MATEYIDGNTIRRASNAAASGIDFLVRDAGSTGLAIRLQKGTGGWYLMTRSYKAKIGPLSAFAAADLPALRQLIARARGLIAEGRDPKPTLQAAVVHRTADGAVAQAAATDGTVLRWEGLRDAFLKWVEKNRATETHRGYKSALGAASNSKLAEDFKAVMGMPITLITTAELRNVRNAILARGKVGERQLANERQAGLTLAAIKSAFSWAVENGDVTGLSSNPASDLKLGRRASANPYAEQNETAREKRSITLDEIGKLMMALDYYPNKLAALAVELQLMTGQRRMTVARARRNHFSRHPTWGMLWKLGPDKSGKYRVLPIPERAVYIVEQALDFGSGDYGWLFPQQRLRKATDLGNRHIAERTISAVLEDLRAVGKPLESAPWVASHDLRRAFVTHMRPRVNSLMPFRTISADDAIPMITRADEGREGLDETVYDQDPALPDKSKIMNEWARMVLEAYGKQMQDFGLA